MIYEAHLRAAEAAHWPLEDSVAWDSIDQQAAAGERHYHEALYDAALIEGYLPLYAARLMQLVWDDVDATAILSLELYEGLRHYTALKRYLDLVGFKPAASADASLVAARADTVDARYQVTQIPEHLAHFMGSELFAAYFFLRIARETREPVLAALLHRMASDEFRHAAAAGTVLEARVAREPEIAGRVLAAAAAFRHYGSDIVDVPVAEQNDFEAIMAYNRRIRLICRVDVTDDM